MADPAVEAARRAIDARYGGPVFQPGERDIDVAREALARIRELHSPCEMQPGVVPTTCYECHDTWPCDTARLCYTSEELYDILVRVINGEGQS